LPLTGAVVNEKAAKELIQVAKQARVRIDSLETELKTAAARNEVALFVLEAVKEGSVDPEDVFEYYDRVSQEGVDFFKKAVALGLSDNAESFGSIIDRKDVSTAGLSKAASWQPTIGGEEVDHFSRGVLELKSMLYGEALPFDQF